MSKNKEQKPIEFSIKFGAVFFLFVGCLGTYWGFQLFYSSFANIDLFSSTLIILCGMFLVSMGSGMVMLMLQHYFPLKGAKIHPRAEINILYLFFDTLAIPANVLADKVKGLVKKVDDKFGKKK